MLTLRDYWSAVLLVVTVVSHCDIWTSETETEYIMYPSSTWPTWLTNQNFRDWQSAIPALENEQLTDGAGIDLDEMITIDEPPTTKNEDIVSIKI